MNLVPIFHLGFGIKSPPQEIYRRFIIQSQNEAKTKGRGSAVRLLQVYRNHAPKGWPLGWSHPPPGTPPPPPSYHHRHHHHQHHPPPPPPPRSRRRRHHHRKNDIKLYAVQPPARWFRKVHRPLHPAHDLSKRREDFISMFLSNKTSLTQGTRLFLGLASPPDWTSQATGSHGCFQCFQTIQGDFMTEHDEPQLPLTRNRSLECKGWLGEIKNLMFVRHPLTASRANLLLANKAPNTPDICRRPKRQGKAEEAKVSLDRSVSQCHFGRKESNMWHKSIGWIWASPV